jgi:hypothetical protein
MNLLMKTIKKYKEQAISENKFFVIKSSLRRGVFNYPQFTYDLEEVPDAIIGEFLSKETVISISPANRDAQKYFGPYFCKEISLKDPIFDKCLVISYDDIEKESSYDESKLYKIGSFAVDAGLCWIGDPCYILHKKEEDNPKSLGNNWHDFVAPINDHFISQSFTFDHGGEGLGILTKTAYGDGVYSVFAKMTKEGLIRQIIIDFENYDFDEEESDI